MGSSQLPNFLPALLIVTAVAYLLEFAFFGSSLDSTIGTVDNVTVKAGVSTGIVTFFQFLTFTVPGIPFAMSVILFFLIILPWLIVGIQLIISLVPFT